MKLCVPEYYKEFKCIANKCKDTCCKGWEIDIDKKTNEFYSQVDGGFGDKLRKNISKTEPKHFIFNSNGKCPFLNNNNLCDIFINLGEEHLCTICSLHPRYFEWFDGVKEVGIGMCCEEAARLILSQNQTFKTYDIDVPFEPCDTYDKNLFLALYKLRLKIIKHIEEPTIPLKNRILNILKSVELIQEKIDKNQLADDFDIKEFNENPTLNNFKPLLNHFLKLEYLDSDFKKYLEKNISYYDIINQNSEKLNAFDKANPEVNTYLENIATYFIWRYFLKGVFDCDIWSKVNLMVVSLIAIKYLYFCKWMENGSLSFEDCIVIAEKYSQEIEYSDDNLKLLSDASYDNYFFSSNYLSGLVYTIL